MSFDLPDHALNNFHHNRPIEDRDPFIDEGPNEFVVLELTPFNHQTHGASVKAVFQVLSSAKAPIGSRRVKMWNLLKPSKFPNQPTDSDRFADFLRKLKGADANFSVGETVRTLLKGRAQGGRLEDNLTRGTRIKGDGYNAAKPDKKPFIDVRWTSVVQTPAEVVAMRASLDAGSTPVAQNAAPATQPHPMYAPGVAPSAAPGPLGGPLNAVAGGTTVTPGNTGGSGW